MQLKRYCITLIVLLFCVGLTYSQEKRTEICVDFRVYSTVMDPSYSSNALRIQEIMDILHKINRDRSVNIVEISFSGAASPEGSDQLNRILAQGRLSAFENFIRKEVDIPDSLICRSSSYIPWDYLKSQIEASDLIYRDTVVSILEEESALVSYTFPNTHVQSRILKLKKLDNGKVWQELNRRFFSKMRNACAVIVTYEEKLPAVAHTVVLDPVVPSATPAIEFVESEHQKVYEQIRKPFYMALKTNLLYDIVAIPNLGAEFYLGNNLSIAGNWQYAWWNNDRKHDYWRTYGGDFAFRYWMGKSAHEKPISGHHIGLYGQMLSYDFELGSKGVLADRWSWAAGVEYGYSLPVSRRLNLDFTLGLGYHWGEFEEYLPIDGHYVWQATKNRNYWGPTKAEISLVWLLGRGNYNAKKGGRQ